MARSGEKDTVIRSKTSFWRDLSGSLGKLAVDTFSSCMNICTNPLFVGCAALVVAAIVTLALVPYAFEAGYDAYKDRKASVADRKATLEKARLAQAKENIQQEQFPVQTRARANSVFTGPSPSPLASKQSNSKSNHR